MPETQQSIFDPSSRSIRRVIFLLHIVTAIEIAIFIFLFGSLAVSLSYFSAANGGSIFSSLFSLGAMSALSLITAVFGIGFTQTAAYGLRRGRDWGYVVAGVKALLLLLSIWMAPFALAIAWFLIPERMRASFIGHLRSEARELRKEHSDASSKPSAT